MILLPPSVPWKSIHERIAAGEQVLRVVEWADIAAVKPGRCLLLGPDLVALRETAAAYGLYGAPVRDQGTPNQHIEVAGEALERMLLTRLTEDFRKESLHAYSPQPDNRHAKRAARG